MNIIFFKQMSKERIGESHMYIYIYIYIYLYIYIYMGVYVYVYVYTCVCVCVMVFVCANFILYTHRCEFHILYKQVHSY